MSKAKPLKPIRPDWLSKTLAGAVLGFTLAVAISGLFAWYGPGGIDAPNKTQFIMWLIAPLWMTLFSTVYLFTSGRAALLWFSGANLLSFGLLWMVQL